MKIKIVNFFLLFPLVSLQAQDLRPDSGIKSASVFMNYSNSIFNRPIEEYKYVNTPRGIEIYETYRHPTNGYVNQTIFPKSMPVAVIKTNGVTKQAVIYKNYSNSIFNKPIEFSTIRPSQVKSYSKPKPRVDNLPKYNGEGDITYGE